MTRLQIAVELIAHDVRQDPITRLVVAGYFDVAEWILDEEMRRETAVASIRDLHAAELADEAEKLRTAPRDGE